MEMQSQKLGQKNNSPSMSSAMKECIENCLSCYQLCNQTIMHCLEMGGHHAEASHIKLLQDCATFCALSAEFMIRESAFHSLSCGLCAEICLACAESCEAIEGKDLMMKACANACRESASSCEEMSKMQ